MVLRRLPDRLGALLWADIEMIDVERRQAEMIMMRVAAFGGCGPS